MCGKRLRSFWLSLVVLGFFCLGSSPVVAQNVVIPQGTWDQILSTVDRLELTLENLKKEQIETRAKYEALLTDKDLLLTKERRWSEILGDSLEKVKKINRVQSGVILVESGVILLGLVIGGAVWLF